ncbi:molybdopterin converting factor subunit 1 [Staphylococcus arlettae]|jgi:sulfur-carrier protein|uniref:Molybdopterin synthase sulfur carrier subunit n=1 Tax=Staphylococcus arlettae TaxID=29378 RepID=A0A2T7BU74_9STAP|nr:MULTISPECIES: molybdopterin converting factor subunit 1 [Staphylococcus]EJY96478.1 molybdopterin synthase small subunit [Staphylococcus arlettae CVD059]ERF49524.1 molybdopterin synthase small subunit [Staphylococcus sp. EGD-HP3]KAB2479223.1 molybdopterin converting factor subunit 1 [Staphylococcus sp. CH99b_3]MBF0738107.1 molybdopterin converting factor subunit 1 [Staphylococcus arlettae]MBK3719724.1 Molybdopterin synthase sulfur carrier subunit [Staphylococcus arlettae]
MQILYFAELKEILKKNTEIIEINDSISVKQLKETINAKYPEVSEKTYQIAVNEEFVQDNDTVKNMDIVALIPPVSGG